LRRPSSAVDTYPDKSRARCGGQTSEHCAVRNLLTRIATIAQALFQAASLSKFVTAVAVMRLVQEGRFARERRALGGGPQSSMPGTPEQDRPKPLKILLQGRPEHRGEGVLERPPVLGLAHLKDYRPALAGTLQVLPQREAGEIPVPHRRDGWTVL
jgi:Beta-lactamase